MAPLPAAPQLFLPTHRHTELMEGRVIMIRIHKHFDTLADARDERSTNEDGMKGPTPLARLSNGIQGRNGDVGLKAVNLAAEGIA